MYFQLRSMIMFLVIFMMTFRFTNSTLCTVSRRAIGNLITVFYIMIVLHNPNLIAFFEQHKKTEGYNLWLSAIRALFD